tara:strand:- start:246 stop:1982 length:1737 start_codon:yes stop_codon:yes gene_type:complete
MAQFLMNIDLNRNQLQNAVIHPLGTAPANPVDGQVYYNSTNGNKSLYIYDGQISAWKSIAGDITSVNSGTTGQLTVANSGGPNPTFSIVTGAVTNGGSALATGDQIFDFVSTATAGFMSSWTAQGETGAQTMIDGQIFKVQGTGILSTALALNGATRELTITHADVTRTNTASTLSPANGASFIVVDTITSSADGHITGVNTKTVTLPSQTVGTVTSIDITPGALIDKTGGPITSNGAIQIDVDLSELSTVTDGDEADFFPIVNSINTQSKIAPSNVSVTRFGAPTANFDMGSNKIINVTNPVDGQDAATKNYVDTLILGSGALIYQGGYNAGTNVPNLDSSPSITINAGFTWVVTADGSFFAETMRVGDMIIANIDSPTVLADWTTVQGNIDLASTTVAGIASFSSVNFDVSAAGQVTIKPNTIILGTDTTGDYVQSVTGGTGIDSSGATSGEGVAHTLSLDLNELPTATPVMADFLAGVDINGNVSSKFLVSDLVLNPGVNLSFSIIGNGSDTVFTLVHSLGFIVSIQMYDSYSGSVNYGETVYAEIKRVATGTQVSFVTAPTSPQTYKVVISKVG